VSSRAPHHHAPPPSLVKNSTLPPLFEKLHLRALAPSLGLRARVSAEHVFESKPDIVVRGAEPKKILEEVLPLIDKLENKARFSVHKRFGPLGSATVEVKPCPAP
jgi:predicted glycosyltransferase